MFWSTQAMFTAEQVAAGVLFFEKRPVLLKKVSFNKYLLIFVNICTVTAYGTAYPIYGVPKAIHWQSNSGEYSSIPSRECIHCVYVYAHMIFGIWWITIYIYTHIENKLSMTVSIIITAIILIQVTINIYIYMIQIQIHIYIYIYISLSLSPSLSGQNGLSLSLSKYVDIERERKRDMYTFIWVVVFLLLVLL